MTRFALKHPIETENATISEITFRRPKLKDIRAMMRAGTTETDPEARKIEQTFAMIVSLTGLPPAAVDEIDPEDLETLSGVLDGFFSTT